jgi:hypothetical protein
LRRVSRVLSINIETFNTMSGSEGGLPSEATISQKLRDVVISIHRTGKEEDLTIKRIRARAEKELSLPDGFLKKDASWKQKSQDTISDAVVSVIIMTFTPMLTMSRINTARKPRLNRVRSQ